MPSLVLLKSPAGGTPGETIPLDADLLVIGRDAELCQIVIPHHAVSRVHAQIARQQGKYSIEDLKARNGTFVNNQRIAARTALHPEDRIKICDFLFRFYDERVKPPGPRGVTPLPPNMRRGGTDTEDADDMTTIESTASRVDAKHFLDVQPSERLRALLDISTRLARTLDLTALLDQVAETLLATFRTADRCFVILLDPAGRPVPAATKTRRPGAEEARFSRTIVKKTLDSLESYMSEDATSDGSLAPNASVADFKIRSVMCVPLVSADGKPLGALQLDAHGSRKFRDDDVHYLTIVANLAAVSVEKAALHETVLAREKERKEIELARAVQLGFLPQSLPEVPGYEFYSHYSPAQTIGGDYYDYIPLPGGRLAVVVGDVAGKGVPAALLVAKLSSEVRFCLLTEPDPARAVALLNNQMIRGGLGDRFVTLAALVLDPVTHEVAVVNAGHVNPLLYRAGANAVADAITTDASGVPLGVMADYEYEAVTVTLECGDVLTVFTDGVTDAMAPDGALFGDDSVNQYLVTDDEDVTAAGCRPDVAGGRLVDAVTRHANGRPQNDDIAVVCFGRLDAAHGPAAGQTRRGPRIQPGPGGPPRRDGGDDHE